MKRLLQWLAVCVFAVLVFVPALAQAQTVADTVDSNVSNIVTTVVFGVVMVSAMYFGSREK